MRFARETHYLEPLAAGVGFGAAFAGAGDGVVFVGAGGADLVGVGFGVFCISTLVLRQNEYEQSQCKTYGIAYQDRGCVRGFGKTVLRTNNYYEHRIFTRTHGERLGKRRTKSVGETVTIVTMMFCRRRRPSAVIYTLAMSLETTAIGPGRRRLPYAVGISDTLNRKVRLRARYLRCSRIERQGS